MKSGTPCSQPSHDKEGPMLICCSCILCIWAVGRARSDRVLRLILPRLKARPSSSEGWIRRLGRSLAFLFATRLR
jgi:hypothetical protein